MVCGNNKLFDFQIDRFAKDKLSIGEVRKAFPANKSMLECVSELMGRQPPQAVTVLSWVGGVSRIDR
jgi:hypothetical protein